MESFEHESLIIGRYKIVSTLGAGGMATVYRAVDSQSGHDVALKVLNSDQVSSARRKARFLEEFVILSKLTHPGIVKVNELHETESGVPFFSMEYLSGASLPSLSALSNQEAMPILTQVASALAYLHSQNIVYCDLKPANILRLLSDEIKLLDFGISREMNAGVSADEAAAMVGTSYYMSPEQIRGDALDARSDIYSFGVLAFELLTGSLPFADEALFNVTASHLAAKVPSACVANPTVLITVDRMIRVCMEKDRRNRYDSMEQVSSRLVAAQASPRRTRFELLRKISNRFFG